MQRLARLQKAKIELSSTFLLKSIFPYITAMNGMPVHFVKTLTRANFENMTDGLVKRIVDVCSECVNKAKMKFVILMMLFLLVVVQEFQQFRLQLRSCLVRHLISHLIQMRLSVLVLVFRVVF